MAGPPYVAEVRDVDGRLRPRPKPRRADPMSAGHSSDADGARSGARPAHPAAGGSQPLLSLSLDEMYAARDERERHSAAAAADAARREREQRAGNRGRFE